MYFDYSIFKSSETTVEKAVHELLSSIFSDWVPVRLVFFGKVTDNAEYVILREKILAAVSAFYDNRRPLVTFVAQAPFDCTLAMECQCVSTEYLGKIDFRTLSDVNYAVLSPDENKLLITEGVLPSSFDIPFLEQSREVFRKLEGILAKEEMPICSIDRQWNYIENIVGEKIEGLQNYQQLNDARSEFYSRTSWEKGYPAATGIGTQAGGIMVEIDAADMANLRRVPIDNALQVAAHEYSCDVLVGESKSKTTPKFERAKAIVQSSSVGDVSAMVYVSGTAAIRGESSLLGVGIERQTVTTLENIEYLIGNDTLRLNDIDLVKNLIVNNFRVYLKDAVHYEKAREIISRRYPAVPAIYVLSDVCRDELLIEIEGTACSC